MSFERLRDGTLSLLRSSVCGVALCGLATAAYLASGKRPEWMRSWRNGARHRTLVYDLVLPGRRPDG